MAEFNTLHVFIGGTGFAVGMKHTLNKDSPMAIAAGVEALLVEHDGKNLDYIVAEVDGVKSDLYGGVKIDETTAANASQAVMRHLAGSMKRKYKGSGN